MRSERDKRLAGELYRADAAVLTELGETLAWLDRYNAAGLDQKQRAILLRERLGAVGANVMVRPPFHCDYGSNISLGDGVFLNFNCVLLDVVPIEIGAGTQIGPGVHIYAADHPRDPELRRKGFECGKPVRIGRNVWIGGGAIILPGVSIGDDAIIGAGAVVTCDVADGATVAGNPARRIR
jgi:maltose O-acetyltransferase